MHRYADLSHTLQDPVKGPIQSHLAFVDFLYDGGVFLHEVTGPEEGRLDLISWLYFDDVRFWELIGWYNNIKDPLREIVQGKILYIPVDPVTISNSISSAVRSFTYLEL